VREYRSLSLWLDRLPDAIEPRPALGGDIDVDVVIVGGGFSGLWTAYYLSNRAPELNIVIVEREICGFGASGRNGGWCEGELAASVEKYAKHGSMADAMRLIRAMHGAVDEVGRVADAEGIDCGFAKGGAVYLARNAAQEKRLIKSVEHEHSLGFSDEDIRLLSAQETTARVNATNVRRGAFFAHNAAIDPAPLVRGLADAVERRGVTIYEHTAANTIDAGVVTTPHGVVRAPIVVRATEGYTSELPGEKRSMVPLYSLMIATEPLSRAQLDVVGLNDRPTFADGRYAVIYGQRTADDRIAFGGRGVPYLFGSRIDPATELHEPTHDLIADTLVELFPVLADVAITHRWGGVLGAPRHWTPSVNFDRVSGMAHLGGYVGEGVCASNLAGQTLAELIAASIEPGEASRTASSVNTDLTTLPWVDVRVRKWEPEPLRWLGVWGTRRVMQRADGVEYSSDKTSKAGELASRLL
jgi:glycine/D-amino acid oxidase-like deaminating enzyme